MKEYISLLVTCLIAHYAMAQKQPNIVVIISDDHSYQTISAYGSKIAQTPQIDRIAKEGAIFNHAYVTNSICGPSRAAILSGKYSHKNGFKDNETSEFNHSQNLFVKDLQKAGYQTAWYGKQHLGNAPQGFDYYSILIDQGRYFNSDFINTGGKKEISQGYVTDVITQKATTWLDQRDTDKPFCLFIGHKATHRTWMPDPKDFGTYDKAELPLPSSFYDSYESRKAASLQEMSIDKDMQMGYDLKMFKNLDFSKDANFTRMAPLQLKAYQDYYQPIYEEYEQLNLKGKELAAWKYRRYMIDYLNTAHSLDRNIGTLLDYLDEHQLAENTIVIYLSDQGFYMGEHGWFDKRFMYEESFRTPMVMRYPALIKAGTAIESMVMNVDLAPTLLELAKVKIPADLQGISFTKALTNPTATPRKQMFYHYYENGEHAVSPHFGISDGRYKLIRFYKRVEGWELFDLARDPQELSNVYGDKKYAKITTRLKKQLQKEAQKLEDTDALIILKK